MIPQHIQQFYEEYKELCKRHNLAFDVSGNDALVELVEFNEGDVDFMIRYTELSKRALK